MEVLRVDGPAARRLTLQSVKAQAGIRPRAPGGVTGAGGVILRPLAKGPPLTIGSHVFPIARPRLVVGRGAKASDNEPDLDLEPLDVEHLVSRKHAEIEYEAKIAIIRDLGSREPRRGPDFWFIEATNVGLGVDLELRAIREALLQLDMVPPSW